MTAPGGQAFRTVERIGNRIPHPFLLFWYLLILLGVGSLVLASNDATAQLPGAKLEPVRDILSVDGLRHLLTTFVDNFIGFPPLGVVLAVLLGVGVAEQAGFLRTAVAATLARFRANSCRWLSRSLPGRDTSWAMHC